MPGLSRFEGCDLDRSSSEPTCSRALDIETGKSREKGRNLEDRSQGKDLTKVMSNRYFGMIGPQYRIVGESF